MELIRLNSISEGSEPLLKRLITELSEDKRVLWLVPGGSNIGLAVKVMEGISEDLSRNLTIYLTDERFGEVGHEDSNAFQLQQAGFDPKQARQVNVLAPGLTLEQTTEQYAMSLSAALENTEVLIAQIGMGPDGHILGALPGTKAADSDKLVVGYVTEQYTRITITPKALVEYKAIAYMFAFGDNKREALLNLLDKNLSLVDQPAQIVKQLPEAYIYNDQITGNMEETA
jgi:6-phosphogluconolactonase/glucosamine-6-phosphate isomerase/deaminase